MASWPHGRAAARSPGMTSRRCRRTVTGTSSSTAWIVDPSEPSLTAWDFVDREYAEVGRFGAEETYVAQRPFAVRVRPSDLVSD